MVPPAAVTSGSMTLLGTTALSSWSTVNVTAARAGSAVVPTPQSAVPAVTAAMILSLAVGTTALNEI